MSKELETTYYRFQSEVRAFLSKLLKNPVDAQPSKYLKDREFTRKKLIDELLKRDVIERHEKILDRTNSDEKEAKYVVKFKVHKKDFEKRIHRIYIKFFEKNLNESVEEMQAWHGSPKRFRRFKERRRTTCNFGWGTYVATDYSVGKKYAKKNGYVYEVTIPDDNGHNYIHGGHISEEEYNKIYSVLIKAFPDYKDEIEKALYISHHPTVNCYVPIFNSAGIQGIPTTSKEISQLFAANGYVGVTWKWLRYVVIFNAEDVKIVNRSRVAESVEEMQAWHGSDKKFSRFRNIHHRSMNGWGTYVTSDENTSKRYAKPLNDGGNGYQYEVNIPDDNGYNYIKDGEQRPEMYDYVYRILVKEFPKKEHEIREIIERCKRFKKFYPVMCGLREYGLDQKKVSLALDKYGIVGYAYPDVYGTSYVIFNKRNVKIVNRTQVWPETQIAESVFENEEEMKKKILNGPDGDVYKKRGGIKLDEEDGGMAAGDVGGDAASEASSSDSSESNEKADRVGSFVQPAFPLQRRTIYAGAQGDRKSTNPILGKTISEGAKKGRRIFITEEQYEMILKEEGLGGATTTTSVADTSDGMLGTVKPGKQFQGPKGKSNDDFMKPAMDRKPGFSMERMK